MKKEYDFSKMKEIDNPYRGKVRKHISINLNTLVLDYFKGLSGKTGIPYQRLIDLYLLDCAMRKRQLKWTG